MNLSDSDNGDVLFSDKYDDNSFFKDGQGNDLVSNNLSNNQPAVVHKPEFQSIVSNDKVVKN